MTDVAASVRQRLLNTAREQGLSFQNLLERYALERMLYRISISPHAQAFVLKGGLLMLAWGCEPSRHTRDIDFLDCAGHSPEQIGSIFREVCVQDVPADGMVYDPGSVEARLVRREGRRDGVEVVVRGHLGSARVMVNVDVGVPDPVVPARSSPPYPSGRIRTRPPTRATRSSAKSRIASG